MAKQRQISDRFWYDTFVSEELTEPDEKLLFVYLLTNQYISITGIYEIAIRTINFDTAIPTPRIKEILSKLSQAGKVHYDQGYVILENYHKYTSYNNPSVRKYVTEQLYALPVGIKQKFADVIKQIHALAMPTPCPGDRQEKQEKRQNSCPPPAQDNPTPCPPQGQPSIPNSNSNSNSNSIPSPLPPQGEKYIRDGVTGKVIENPDWKEGKEGRKENSASSKEGKEGKDDVPQEVAPGVWLSENQLKELREEYGNDAVIEVPDQVSEWIAAKGMVLKDPMKICQKFARKFVETHNG